MISLELLLIIASWTVFVEIIGPEQISQNYEKWNVHLVNYDIPHSAAMTIPMNKTILIEADLYPNDNAGCDLLKHEYYHAMWYKISNGEGEDHMRLIQEGNFC